MNKFGKASMEKLATVDNRLRWIMEEVLQVVNITVICGHRNKNDQDRAVNEGKSKLPWPHSNHNTLPSRAVDIAQYFPEEPHIHWNDKKSFAFVAGVVMAVAYRHGVRIRWGNDWNNNQDTGDEKGLEDMPHFEILDD